MTLKATWSNSENYITKGVAGRTNPFISGQEGRTVCSVPEDRYENVPETEGCSDRCENTVGGELTLKDARWEMEMPGWTRREK